MCELIDLVKFVVDRALVTQMQTATQYGQPSKCWCGCWVWPAPGSVFAQADTPCAGSTVVQSGVKAQQSQGVQVEEICAVDTGCQPSPPCIFSDVAGVKTASVRRKAITVQNRFDALLNTEEGDNARGVEAEIVPVQSEACQRPKPVVACGIARASAAGSPRCSGELGASKAFVTRPASATMPPGPTGSGVADLAGSGVQPLAPDAEGELVAALTEHATLKYRTAARMTQFFQMLRAGAGRPFTMRRASYTLTRSFSLAVIMKAEQAAAAYAETAERIKAAGAERQRQQDAEAATGEAASKGSTSDADSASGGDSSSASGDSFDRELRCGTAGAASGGSRRRSRQPARRGGHVPRRCYGIGR